MNNNFKRDIILGTILMIDIVSSTILLTNYPKIFLTKLFSMGGKKYYSI